MFTRNMEIEDYLKVMEQNAHIFHEYASMSLETKQFLAKVNMITGTAKTFIDEHGDVFGCAGIHYVGVGEAWCITPPNIRDDRRFALLREAKRFFKEQRDSLNLWRIYAANYISQTYLEHLGFEKANNLSIWTRTTDKEPIHEGGQ